MSCIASITPKLTREQLAEAKKQKLNFTSPAPRPSLVQRLVILASDSNSKLRERVALDYRIPWNIQRDFTVDPDKNVRACLARNEHIEPGILATLARDSEESVRGHVALHPRCPQYVLDSFSRDESEMVRSLAYLAQRLHSR